MSAQTIVPTEHDKREWSRLAQAAYACDRNELGHKFSMAATLRIGEPCTLAFYDTLQGIYRAWLIGGIPYVTSGHTLADHWL